MAAFSSIKIDNHPVTTAATTKEGWELNGHSHSVTVKETEAKAMRK